MNELTNNLESEIYKFSNLCGWNVVHRIDEDYPYKCVF